MEKYIEKLNQAIKSIQLADHMTYVTFPLFNEQKLLLKIFEEIHKAIIYFIEAILEYEYIYKRIQLYKDNKDNLSTFFEKCAKNYGITNEQIKKIKELIELHNKHKQSAMEFIRKQKVVIMSDNLRTES